MKAQLYLYSTEETYNIYLLLLYHPRSTFYNNNMNMNICILYTLNLEKNVTRYRIGNQRCRNYEILLVE